MPKPHVLCRMRQAIENKGVTQAALAAALGCDPAVLNRIIKGLRNPRVTFAIRAARLLGTTVTDLWPEAVPKRRK